MDFKDFYSPGGVDVPERLFDGYSFTVIDILPEFYGHAWDDVALAYVHAFRPTSIRVCTSAHCDSRANRVTVWVNDEPDSDGYDIIYKISMELQIYLPTGFRNAGELRAWVTDNRG